MKKKSIGAKNYENPTVSQQDDPFESHRLGAKQKNLEQQRMKTRSVG